MDYCKGSVTEATRVSGRWRGDIYELLRKHDMTPGRTGAAIVYFLQGSNGFIKIGRAINVNKRIQSLSSGSPVELKLLAITKVHKEFEIHRMFKESRSRGEWFKPSPELITFIEKLQSRN